MGVSGHNDLFRPVEIPDLLPVGVWRAEDTAGVAGARQLPSDGEGTGRD